MSQTRTADMVKEETTWHQPHMKNSWGMLLVGEIVFPGEEYTDLAIKNQVVRFEDIHSSNITETEQVIL